MPDGWENYYLLIGSAAGALIGLMFVVVTLTAGRGRDQSVLLLSGAATAPTMSPRLFGAVSGGLALLGLGMGIRTVIGIARAPLSGAENNAFDIAWYGVAPALAYAGLGVAAAMIVAGSAWGASAIAAALMALLLVSIHGEWDLVTFLAPLAAPADASAADDARP